MKKIIFIVVALYFTASAAFAQQPWSRRMADTAMRLWPDSIARRSDETGMLLQGILSVWQQTADKKYFKYVQDRMDALIDDDGAIKGYKKDDHTPDDIGYGRIALTLFNITEEEKYYKAALQLRSRLTKQPRNAEGDADKKSAASGMWPDDLYSTGPFYTACARVFHSDTDLNTIAGQFILAQPHVYDTKIRFSRNLRERGEGRYMMALVDVLDNFPGNSPDREKLLVILNRLAGAVKKYQDPETGLWYGSNYPEASTSCMFVYALAKAARQGYLPKNYAEVARKGYRGILNKFTGLIKNDPGDVGAFIMAGVEIGRLADLPLGRGRTVLVDSYFNNEHRRDITGRDISYHYKWDEQTDNGFSFLGHAFNNYGMKTGTLYDAPTAANLQNTGIYIIVDPDIPKENPGAKYIEEDHIKAITEWVRNGGVLAVLNNDTGNAEFVHLNKLMAKFGIQFNLNSVNNVKGTQFEMGAIYIPPGNEIFKNAKKIYVKDISTLHVASPARSVLTDKDGVIIAIAKYGKGTVFAVGDPWFYNEYTDGRKLSVDFQNFTAANDLVKWLIQQMPGK